MKIEIERITAATDELAEAIARLLPQLSASAPAVDAARLHSIADTPSTALFAARGDGRIVGMLTLVWYDIPTGRKAWIEDVVVDRAARGHGAGRALVAAALDHAARIGAAKILLTSREERRAARALYGKMGFEAAETEVFALKTDRK